MSLKVLVLMLSGLALRSAAAVEITGNQLVRSMKPDQGASSAGGLSAEKLGVRRVREFVHAADGSLIFMGDSVSPEGVPEIVIGRVERGSDKVSVLRRSPTSGADATVSIHMGAFHYPLRDGVLTRMVIVETFGYLGNHDEENNETRLSILGTMRGEAGRLLGSAEIGMADVAYDPRPDAPWPWTRVSSPRPGHPPDIDRRGRTIEWRLALGRVSLDDHPDILVWQRHLVSPPRGAGKPDLVVEKENWAALSSRVNAEGYEWIPDVPGMPSTTDILWRVLGVTEAW